MSPAIERNRFHGDAAHDRDNRFERARGMVIWIDQYRARTEHQHLRNASRG